MNCIFCNESFSSDYEVRCHLENAHDWVDLTEKANQRFVVNSNGEMPSIACVHCKISFSSSQFDDFLHHVLSMCPTSDTKYLYSLRKNVFLNIVREALEKALSKGRLGPSGVLRPACDWMLTDVDEVDLAAMSSSTKQMILVEAGVPWDMNMPCVQNQKLEMLTRIASSFIRQGFECRFYSVQVGARGINSNSFSTFLNDVGFEPKEIVLLQEEASEAAIQESKKLFWPPACV